MFKKGDEVQSIYNDDVFVVKKVYMQSYAGKPDQTVLFEPAMKMGQWQETPWDKGKNLKLINKEGIA